MSTSAKLRLLLVLFLVPLHIVDYAAPPQLTAAYAKKKGKKGKGKNNKQRRKKKRIVVRNNGVFGVSNRSKTQGFGVKGGMKFGAVGSRVSGTPTLPYSNVPDVDRYKLQSKLESMLAERRAEEEKLMEEEEEWP